MQSEPFQQLLDKAQRFLHNHIIPIEPLLLSHQWLELDKVLADLRQQVNNEKMWAPHLPTSLGGLGLQVAQLGQISKVLGQSPLGHYCFGCQAPDAGNAELLHLYATKQIKQQFLEPLAAGTIRSCFAMTEPHMSGSNPTRLTCQAIANEDGWLINGHKWFTTAADGADFTIVMAVTDTSAAKHQQASMLIVPMTTKGVTLKRNISVMGSTGQGYFSHGEVLFENVQVGSENLLGKQGHGFLMAQQRLGPGRIQHCMRWIGIAQRCFDILCKHVKHRQITDTQSLADQPLMQAKIAECYAAIKSTEYLVQATADRIDKDGFDSAKHDISMIKFHTAQMLQTVMDHTVQALGALGVTDDTVVAFFFREERAARIYDGPDEVHKLSLAKQLLKNY